MPPAAVLCAAPPPSRAAIAIPRRGLAGLHHPLALQHRCRTLQGRRVTPPATPSGLAVPHRRRVALQHCCRRTEALLRCSDGLSCPDDAVSRPSHAVWVVSRPQSAPSDAISAVSRIMDTVSGPSNIIHVPCLSDAALHPINAASHPSTPPRASATPSGAPPTLPRALAWHLMPSHRRPTPAIAVSRSHAPSGRLTPCGVTFAPGGLLAPRRARTLPRYHHAILCRAHSPLLPWCALAPPPPPPAPPPRAWRRYFVAFGPVPSRSRHAPPRRRHARPVDSFRGPWPCAALSLAAVACRRASASHSHPPAVISYPPSAASCPRRPHALALHAPCSAASASRARTPFHVCTRPFCPRMLPRAFYVHVPPLLCPHPAIMCPHAASSPPCASTTLSCASATLAAPIGYACPRTSPSQPSHSRALLFRPRTPRSRTRAPVPLSLAPAPPARDHCVLARHQFTFACPVTTPSGVLPPPSHVPEAPFVPPPQPSRGPALPSRAILAAALSHPVQPSPAPTPPVRVSTAAFTHPGPPLPCASMLSRDPPPCCVHRHPVALQAAVVGALSRPTASLAREFGPYATLTCPTAPSHAPGRPGLCP
ncbi:hypothetical protein DENSPDRAFT_934574 [Dentipellis sp. KUC8613]|nr:hypothetical protein DENSPDRAFT_934574 [Dentipellis sp. KUC8613]